MGWLIGLVLSMFSIIVLALFTFYSPVLGKMIIFMILSASVLMVVMKWRERNKD